MNTIFYVSALVAIVATARVITCRSAIHALLYLIVSLLAVAMVFFLFGAPFIAALEVIIYAGAIMVLFVFIVMMLNIDRRNGAGSRRWFEPAAWFGPIALVAILVAELVYVLSHLPGALTPAGRVSPDEVGAALFGVYLLGVELASILLTAGLVGAYHLGRRASDEEEEGTT